MKRCVGWDVYGFLKGVVRACAAGVERRGGVWYRHMVFLREVETREVVVKEAESASDPRLTTPGRRHPAHLAARKDRCAMRR